MPFDPAKPVEGTLCDAAEMRSQLNALHDEILAIPQGPPGPPGPEGPAFGSAMVDSTGTLPAGSAAAASAFLLGNVLHFSFSIPQGPDGAAGPPGEVTNSQLATEIATAQTTVTNAILPQTSANSNAVTALNLTVSNPPTQAEVQALADKLDELIAALRR